MTRYVFDVIIYAHLIDFVIENLPLIIYLPVGKKLTLVVIQFSINFCPKQTSGMWF